MTQHSRRPFLSLTAAALALFAAACGGTPQPPQSVPYPQSPQPPASTAIHFADDIYPRLPALRALPFTLRWSPPAAAQGEFVVLMLEPQGPTLPVFEVRGHAGFKVGDRVLHRELTLAPVGDGAYMGLVAAPIGATEVPVEIDVTYIDGTRLTQRLALLVAKRDFPATRLRVAPRYTSPDSATLVRVAREQAAVRAMRDVFTPVPLWDGPFQWPLRGVTTSPFGQRRLFNNELRSRHTGLDIDADAGDPVHAANSGRVAMSADLFFNGQAVFIDHGLGLYTGYFHLSHRDVVAGQWVEKGDVIGRVGATGRVTGPHLHWHLYLQGFSLDPRSLLDPDFTRSIQRLPVYSPFASQP